MNKIISVDEKTTIDNILQRDILIPVKVYKIPIKINSDNELNFLEKTILELKEIDKNLGIKDIIKLLGLEGKEDLVKFVLDKIDEDNLVENTQNNDKEEVKIYWFYQELITGKLLPIISKEIKEFCYVKKQNWSNIQDIKNIKFEKDNKEIGAKSFKYSKFSKPSQEEFIKTILSNNHYFVNSWYLTKINYKNLSNFNLTDNEDIYLHTKLFIPKDNRDVILITDGLDGDFSYYFSSIIEESSENFINDLRTKAKIDIETTNKEQNVQIPFDSKINNHKTVKSLIKRVEINLQKYQTDIGAYKKSQYKKYILTDLFDAVEQSFEKLSKGLKDSELINKKQIRNLVKQKGFKLQNKMEIFSISSRNNIQKFIAKAVFYNCEELQQLNKNSFIFLDGLLDIRNDLKHSKPLDISEIDIDNYIKQSYDIISKILQIKQINIKKDLSIDNIVENEQELYFNASYDIDKEFLSVQNKIDNNLKDKITQIKFLVDELQFSHDSIKQTINEIYSIFEYIFKDNKQVDKKEVFKKYPDLPIELSTVKIIKSLGAYYLNYIFSFGNSQDLTNFIAKIIRLRGHGNQKIGSLYVSNDELKKLKSDAFKYIKQIIQGEIK